MKTELREYQTNIVRAALQHNLLIVLPTGLGKTNIAIEIVRQAFLSKLQRVLILAPTRPLVFQHAESFQKVFSDHHVETLTGSIPPIKRSMLFDRASLIIATGAAILKDLEAKRIDLTKLDIVIFDEAHHAHTSTYAYSVISQALADDCRRHALTASPGYQRGKIERVRQFLRLEKIIYKDETDQEVQKYMSPVAFQLERLELPEDIIKISTVLNQLYQGYVQSLEKLTEHKIFRIQDLLKIKDEQSHKLRQNKISRSGYMKIMQCYGLAMAVNFAKNLVESQGIDLFRRHLEKIRITEKRSFLNRPEMKSVHQILATTSTDHPKLSKLFQLIDQELQTEPNAKIIVFTNYALTAQHLYQKLQSINLGSPALLLGKTHAGTEGQHASIVGFRAATYNILLCTSVGEEGLDIEGANLVIMYEPVVSEIRLIQRRGRTGRMFQGKAIVLIAQGTIDEVYQRQAQTKEDRMKSILRLSNKTKLK